MSESRGLAYMVVECDDLTECSDKFKQSLELTIGLRRKTVKWHGRKHVFKGNQFVESCRWVLSDENKPGE